MTPDTGLPLAHKTAVILAGGNAARMGAVGKTLPKPLFPVSKKHTLLTRNLEWLILGGCSRIIISTTPSQYPVISWHINQFREHLTLHYSSFLFPHIEVFPNDEHARGPVHALASVAAWSDEQSLLFCLSDICFVSNPFPRLLHPCLSEASLAVFTYKTSSTDEITRSGGVAAISDNHCMQIYLRPDDCPKPTGELHLWSGMALLDLHVLKELQLFAAMKSLAAEEDFINHCIILGHLFTAIPIDRFINVNTMHDHRIAMALISHESNNGEDEEI